MSATRFRSHPGGAGARIKGSFSEHNGIGAAAEGDYMPDPDEGVRDRYKGIGARIGGTCMPEPAVATSNEVLAIAQRPHIRSEKHEETACDNFIAKRGGREAVVRFSQPRHTMQTLGIPDRRYRTAGVVFWWDVKKADGRLRAEQLEFMEREAEYGHLAACGTAEDLVEFVNGLIRSTPSERTKVGHALARALRDRYKMRPKKAKRGKV